MLEMFRTKIFSGSNLVNSFRCYLSRLFSSFHLIQEVETWDRDLDLEVCLLWKGLLVVWLNVELFAVPQEKCEPVYAAAPSFWLIGKVSGPLVSCGNATVCFLFLGVVIHS